MIYKNTHLSQRGRLFVAKFSPAGKLLWIRNSDIRLGLEIQVTTDGQNNIYLSSYYSSPFTIDNVTVNSSGVPNGIIFLAKFNPGGRIQWINSINSGSNFVQNYQLKIIGGLSNNVYSAILSTPANSSPFNPLPSTIIVKKFDQSGAQLWSQSASQDITNIAGPAYGYYSPLSITLDSTENLYLSNRLQDGTIATFGNTTLSYGSNSTDNVYLAKLNSIGNWKWAKLLALGGPSNYAIAASGIRNDLTILRQFWDATNSLEANYVSKIDTTGNVLQTTTLNNRQVDFTSAIFSPTQIAIDNFGNNYISGETIGTTRIGNLNLIALPSSTSPTSRPLLKIFIAKLLNRFNTIAGTLFIDANGNGVKDAGEKPFKNGLVEVTPGPYYAASDSSGTYNVYLPNGAFQVSASASSIHYTFTPQNLSISFTGAGQTITKDFALAPIPNRNDVKVTLTNLSQARAGFPLKYRLTFRNEGTTVLTDSLSLKFQAANLNLVGASVNPAAGQNNFRRWYYQNLQPNETRNIDLEFTVAASTPINSNVLATTRINPVATDFFTLNNYDTLNHLVTGSFDPNDKQVNFAKLTPTQVRNGALLEYVIRFQNTGNNTAFSVLVRDSISDKLLMPSFEMLSASHPYTF